MVPLYFKFIYYSKKNYFMFGPYYSCYYSGESHYFTSYPGSLILHPSRSKLLSKDIRKMPNVIHIMTRWLQNFTNTNTVRFKDKLKK